MGKPRFRLWVVLLVVAAFVPTLTAEKWGPKVFGAEWFARYGGPATMAYGVVMTLIVGILLLVSYGGPMLSFFGGGPAERRIRKYGRPARATILRVGENSAGGVATVNDQPYLNLAVRVEDGVNPPYETDFDALVPRATLPQFQPGAVIRVKVDPRDPRKVVPDFGVYSASV